VTTAPGVTTDTHLEVLSGGECRRLLGLSTLGRIAFVVDGQPLILPVNYRLLDDESGMWILLRTRPGNAIDNAPERVAFEIDGIDYPHHQGWSVLVRGVLHHLDHNEIELFAKRFDPQPWPQQERAAWVAVKTRTVTGRRLHTTQPDWAFSAEAYR
jgi:uncharacterized protein